MTRPDRDPDFALTSPLGVTKIEVWDNDIVCTDVTRDDQDVIIVTDENGARRVTFTEFLSIFGGVSG